MKPATLNSAAPPVRRRWLRAMYLYTALGAGLTGLAMLLAPVPVFGLLGIPPSDPSLTGVVASVYLAFGGVALLGLRAPLRFAPLLLLQLAYKLTWLLAIFLPMALARTAPPHAWLLALAFLSYVAGDLVAIPFRRLLAREDTD